MLAVAAVCALTGCSIGPLGPADARTVSLAELATLTKVTFPTGTTVEDSTYLGFQDWHVEAKVRMPRHGVDAFFADSGWGRPVPGLRSVFMNGSGPTPGERIVGADQTKNSGYQGVYRKILCDVTDPVTATCYLVAFTT